MVFALEQVLPSPVHGRVADRLTLGQTLMLVRPQRTASYPACRQRSQTVWARRSSRVALCDRPARWASSARNSNWCDNSSGLTTSWRMFGEWAVLMERIGVLPLKSAPCWRPRRRLAASWLTASEQGDVKIHSKVQTNTTLIVEYKNNRIFLAKIKDSKQSKISKVMLKTMTNKIYLLLFIIITTQLYINSLKIILLI